ncbi:hypothetical protein POVCU1_017480 [Plasmodium ovale curtisi]|uniref:Uncharacterized protein n=1 Tax=Plasmodium ovale curtisi TaxID=864141 RepID=A0A1A8WAK8_PLAOA|nr:hypothetical protein POVCU1_017480 [Plasmodium ovale curtisi]
MAMNALYNSRLWRGITRGTKGILQSEKLHMFRNSERRDLSNNKVNEKWKKCTKTGGKGYPEEEYTGTFIEKEVLPSGKEFEEKVFKKMKIYYVDKNLFFIFGCFTSLYSVFVWKDVYIECGCGKFLCHAQANEKGENQTVKSLDRM